MNAHNRPFAVTLLSLLLAGCASTYVANPRPAAAIAGPGAGLSAGERDALTDVMVRRDSRAKPLAGFPANLAVARVQSARTYHRSPYDREPALVDQLRVVNTRELEEDLYEKVSKWPLITNVTRVSPLLLGTEMATQTDIRRVAGQLNSDILLLYTFNSHVKRNDWFAPLSIASLGTAPTIQVNVTSTVSAILVDSRTGYLYAMIEASGKSYHFAGGLNEDDAKKTATRRADRRALERMVKDFEGAWAEVLRQHAGVSAQPTVSQVSPSGRPALKGRYERYASPGSFDR